jgi:hypothetical protein
MTVQSHVHGQPPPAHLARVQCTLTLTGWDSHQCLRTDLAHTPVAIPTKTAQDCVHTSWWSGGWCASLRRHTLLATAVCNNAALPAHSETYSGQVHSLHTLHGLSRRLQHAK